jgi:hypothetical protein
MEVVYPAGTMSTGSTQRLRTGADAGAQVEVRFGVGGLVCFDTPCGRSTTPAAGCGFRQACPWGGDDALSDFVI